MASWRDLTEADLKKIGDRHTLKPSKYRNQKTVVDGITFDSKKEAQRYHELKLLEKAGQITDLTLQPRFSLDVALLVGGGMEAMTKIGEYVADFSYTQRGVKDVYVVEDTKGLRTALYRWKAKHFNAQYGIAIKET